MALIIRGHEARSGLADASKHWPSHQPLTEGVIQLAAADRPGGTTFHFVNDGIESALARAKLAAGGRDIRTRLLDRIDVGRVGL